VCYEKVDLTASTLMNCNANVGTQKYLNEMRGDVDLTGATTRNPMHTLVMQNRLKIKPKTHRATELATDVM
jgi:hypothetical protein